MYMYALFPRPGKFWCIEHFKYIQTVFYFREGCSSLPKGHLNFNMCFVILWCILLNIIIEILPLFLFSANITVNPLLDFILYATETPNVLYLNWNWICSGTRRRIDLSINIQKSCSKPYQLKNQLPGVRT